MPNEFDAAWREALRTGRDEAWGRFFDSSAATMLAAARAVLGAQSEAEDAVQQAFLALYRVRQSVAAAADPRAYAVQAARRCALRSRSRVRPGETVVADRTPPLEAHSRSLDLDVALERALMRLDPPNRELIALKLEAGLTFRAIGELLAVSPDTVATRYRRALEVLRRQLGVAP